MKLETPRGCKRWIVGCAALALLVSGCGQVADISGAVAGGGAALASSNPAVGYAIGISVRAAVAAGMNGVMRGRQRAEQDAVAAAIGRPNADAALPWAVRHTIPIGNQQGEVRLVRRIDTPLAECREALFSVAEDATATAPAQWYLTTACRQGDTWKWAAAEPATPRWGSLQ